LQVVPLTAHGKIEHLGCWMVADADDAKETRERELQMELEAAKRENALLKIKLLSKKIKLHLHTAAF